MTRAKVTIGSCIALPVPLSKLVQSMIMTYSSRHGMFFNLKVLGPVVQSIVSLMSSLVVNMLTVLVSTISNLQVFFQQKY